MGGARLLTITAPRFPLLPLPFLFFTALKLFGPPALHKVEMQRPDFRQKQKFPIARREE